MSNKTLAQGKAGGAIPYIQLDLSSPLPLYEQLCRAVRAAIVDGTLATGIRLASTRDLAQALSISRVTVMAALERLHSEGYLVARRGAGNFVVDTIPDRHMHAPVTRERNRSADSAQLPALSKRGAAMSALIITGPRGTVPRQFHPRRPPLDVFPLRDWMRLMRRQWAGLRREHLDYGDPSGLPALREAIARHVGVTRGIHCNPDQVIVTNGSQQAFDVLFRTLLDPGDSVWIEDPGPLEVRGALLAAGAQLQPIAVDKDGIDVAVGIESAPKARLAVVSPSHQYPTGTTLSAKRRRTLLDWAAAARSWVIEDDYDSHFRYQGRPMAGLVTLNLSPAVIHVGTFSKTMFPSLRLGFCIVPHTIAAAVSNARAIADRNSPLATQAALAEFIDSGQYDRHLRRVRIACQERYVALRDSFARYVGATAALSDASAGSHVLAWLENEGAPSPESRATRVARDAAAAGLAIFPLSRYHLVPPRRDALVLGYGTMTPDRIAAGTRVLADIIRKTV